MVRFPAGVGYLSVVQGIQTCSGDHSTQPPIQCIVWSLSLVVKLPGHGHDCSSLSSAEDKNDRSCISAGLIPFWCAQRQLYLLHCLRL